jgi:hypothetical protein
MHNNFIKTIDNAQVIGYTIDEIRDEQTRQETGKGGDSIERRSRITMQYYRKNGSQLRCSIQLKAHFRQSELRVPAYSERVFQELLKKEERSTGLTRNTQSQSSIQHGSGIHKKKVSPKYNSG